MKIEQDKPTYDDLHKAIAKLGDFAPGTGRGNAFMPGSRCEKMQDALMEVYRLGFTLFEKLKKD